MLPSQNRRSLLMKTDLLKYLSRISRMKILIMMVLFMLKPVTMLSSLMLTMIQLLFYRKYRIYLMQKTPIWRKQIILALQVLKLMSPQITFSKSMRLLWLTSSFLNKNTLIQITLNCLESSCTLLKPPLYPKLLLLLREKSLLILQLPFSKLR